MTKIVAVALLAAMTVLGTVAAVSSVDTGAGGRTSTGQKAGIAPQAPAPRGGVERQEVSRDQYDILVGQCVYRKTSEAQRSCRAEVRERFSVGAFNPYLDCRAYSGVRVCGVLELTPAQRSCVQESVDGGLTRRRAEVECYAFR
ncbi:hypothetical protein [Microbispora sp. H11081]|uniref:hypothetical protein n=1 Tax=Microbispora sp. H11081 TaxID=2729107 RepID=UPI001B8C6701|nr:hypothetical protein [Microbispora sp. H11081]